MNTTHCQIIIEMIIIATSVCFYKLYMYCFASTYVYLNVLYMSYTFKIISVNVIFKFCR